MTTKRAHCGPAALHRNLEIRIMRLLGEANRSPLFARMRLWRVPGGFSVAVQTLDTHTHTHLMLLWLPACVCTVIWLLFACCCCSSRCCSCLWGPIRVSLAVDCNPFAVRFIVCILSCCSRTHLEIANSREWMEMSVSVYTRGKLSRGLPQGSVETVMSVSTYSRIALDSLFSEHFKPQ